MQPPERATLMLGNDGVLRASDLSPGLLELLQRADVRAIDAAWRGAVLLHESRSRPHGLPHAATSPHDARAAQPQVRGRMAAAGHHEVVDVLRVERAEGDAHLVPIIVHAVVAADPEALGVMHVDAPVGERDGVGMNRLRVEVALGLSLIHISEPTRPY